MKRAVFKIGKRITIESRHGDETFTVPIDVDAWLRRREWDFDLEEGQMTQEGTSIVIRSLNSDVSKAFRDGVFHERLTRALARDYSVFLQNGFSITVNDEVIRPYEFKVLEGGPFEPVRYDYVFNGVDVSIVAGMASRPPDDADSAETSFRNVDYHGWFVACNDRIVLAGDKTQRTIWGHDGFQSWHPQYNGFMGLVNFHSADPRLLPWTTTKRDVDITAPVYRDALARMKAATRPYISYTNARKLNLEEAKAAEEAMVPVSVTWITERREPAYPRLSTPSTHTTVNYSVPREQVVRAAESFGNKRMSNREVGRRTFDYYMKDAFGEEE